MTAAGLDFISDGRCILGLGASGPQVVEGFHGVPYEKPLMRIKETIEVVRRVVRREVIDFHGQTIDIPLPEGEGTGLGKPLKLINRPVRDAVPIWWASLMGNAVAATAEVADGWLPIMFIPERADERLGRRSRRAASRSARPTCRRSTSRPAACSRSVTTFPSRRSATWAAPARRCTSEAWALAARTSTTTSRCGYGFEQAAKEIQDLYLDGKKEEAAAKVPEEWLEKTSLVGPASYIAERVARLQGGRSHGAQREPRRV